MSAIHAIDVNSAHKITSGQVVVDLQTAVKELVENSIDAGATSLGILPLNMFEAVDDASAEIRFKEFGLKSIEVADNGLGIAPSDYATVGECTAVQVQGLRGVHGYICTSARKHYTSKLSRYEDLASIATFGFRGEALASLCALSESVTITTATKEETPMGTILEFDDNGALKAGSGKVARQVRPHSNAVSSRKPMLRVLNSAARP
jgi:DNA mismatch repair protein PMS2